MYEANSYKSSLTSHNSTPRM